MQVEIKYQPSFALAQVRLASGESVVAESGAMVSMSANLAIKTGSSAAGGGGLGGMLKGLGRKVLTGESFFLNTYTAQGGDGEITLAPTLPGDVASIALNNQSVIIQSTSYLAGAAGIQVDTKFGGLKTFLGGEGLFMLKASGTGEVIITSFGAIHLINLAGPFIVDTGHIVAFDDSLSFEVKRVGSWKATFLSGEGLVTRFNGKGRLWIQSRNPQAFGKLVGSKLPPRQG